VQYKEITTDGLKIQQGDRRSYILKGKNIINTQDWAANTALVEQLSPLAAEIQVAGSAREPGLMTDAVREGILADGVV
jgi:hypothetical protein